LTSELLRDLIEPDVKALRSELFGDSSAPFPNYDDAVAWIEKESEVGKPNRDAQELRSIGRKVLNEARACFERWDGLLGFSQRFDVTLPMLKYVKPSCSRVVDRGYWSGSRLPRLHSFVERTAHRTGFPEEALVAFVLSGLSPLLPGITVTLSCAPFSSPRPPEITIRLRKPNITFRDLHVAYEMVQQELKMVPPSFLGESDRELVEAIKKLGGVPEKDKNEFWDDIAAELGKDTRDAPRVQFSRLKKRLPGELLISLYRTTN
jgi:hypothetical protein